MKLSITPFTALGHNFWHLLALVAVSVAAAGTYLYSSNPALVMGAYIAATCGLSDRAEVCYEEKIPALMDRGYSMEDAFSVLIEVKAIDTEYLHCHVLAHLLAEKETAKDPSKWKEVALRTPLTLCSSGGLHGAFLGYFKDLPTQGLTDETIISTMEDICTNEVIVATGYSRLNCFHAVGHLLVYVTEGEFDRALGLCDELIAPNERDTDRQNCYHGVFMQLFQPLEPEDYALIEGREITTKEAALRFCDTYAGAQRLACSIEQWPVFDDILEDPARVSLVCETLWDDPTYRKVCMDGVIVNTYTSFGLTDPDWPQEYCSALPDTYIENCFARVASRVLQFDTRAWEDAVAVCSAAPKPFNETCYQELDAYTYYIYEPDDPYRAELCRHLPLKTKQCTL